mmetsp:Transcript_38703/g.81231  ORF Transcript_38703/g.81231 Transcript_38703/m.81231 type:complete len:229 (+) Transcript_38703:250-936(+)
MAGRPGRAGLDVLGELGLGDLGAWGLVRVERGDGDVGLLEGGGVLEQLLQLRVRRERPRDGPPLPRLHHLGEAGLAVGVGGGLELGLGLGHVVGVLGDLRREYLDEGRVEQLEHLLPLQLRHLLPVLDLVKRHLEVECLAGKRVVAVQDHVLRRNLLHHRHLSVFQLEHHAGLELHARRRIRHLRPRDGGEVVRVVFAVGLARQASHLARFADSEAANCLVKSLDHTP